MHISRFGFSAALVLILLSGQNNCASEMHQAIRAEENSKVQALSIQKKLLTRKDAGRTPLLEATMLNKSESSALLASAGSDVNALEKKDGQSFARPLFYAASWGNVDVMRSLLGSGAPVDAKGWQDMTPLMEAARMGQEEAVRVLLENGANPDAIDRLGRTPLIWAAITGRAECIRLLLIVGADTDAKDMSGKGALSYAVEFNRKDIVKIFRAASSAKPKENNVQIIQKTTGDK